MGAGPTTTADFAKHVRLLREALADIGRAETNAAHFQTRIHVC